MSDAADWSLPRRRTPAAEPPSHSEKWSVSRTSNLFVVGLLLPILPPEPHGLLKVRVVLEYAECAPRVLFAHGGTWLAAQLCDLLFQLFHTLFKCLRHAAKISQCLHEF